jgi:Uma2 family endonuclease
VAVEKTLVTAEELLAMPDDGRRRELIDGEVRTMAPAGDEHGDIEAVISGHLFVHLRAHPIGRLKTGETGFRLRRDPDRVRAPDVAVVLYARRPRETIGAGYLEGAPDLAVEVVSPWDTAGDVAEKVEDWLRGGARLVWVVYPHGPRLSAHRPDGSAQMIGPEDEVDGGEVLPEFRMRLRDLLTLH